MAPESAPTFSVRANGADSATIAFGGQWRLGQGCPAAEAIVAELPQGELRRLRLNDEGLASWDTGLMVALYSLGEWADDNGVILDAGGLSHEAQGLLDLARAVPEKGDAHRDEERAGILTMTGEFTLRWSREFCDLMSFVGSASIACFNALRGQARYRGVDFWMLVQQTGVDALPIVALLSFLVGLIFAFVGAVQLEALGASIYIADLVGISMTREMGAVMTAIILSGRTGAAFAATIGSMKANEELDALKTMGIPPVDFLVVPRILAMVLMMPLLVLFSMFVGMLGGLIIGVFMLDLSTSQYLQQTVAVVNLTQFLIGLTKALVFAVLVAAAGCLRGTQAGGSSEDVGTAATSAVVTGITAVIVADASFAVILNIIGV
ncbi:MAG: MlaE family ABC transporter permease [Opitutales bacterium]